MLSGTKIYSVIREDKGLRAASRIYFWIALNIGPQFQQFDRAEWISRDFSKYHIDKYLSVLVKRGWIRTDGKGNYFLSSFKKVLALEGIACKEPRIKSLIIPEQAFSSCKNWFSFIVGEGIVSVAFTTRACNPRSKHFSSDNESIKSSIDVSHAGFVQGVSNSIIAKTFNIHPSTASRWKKRGEIAGYKVAQAYVSARLPGRSWDYLVKARDEIVGGSRLVIFNKEICWQMPSLICLGLKNEPEPVPVIVEQEYEGDILEEMDQYRFHPGKIPAELIAIFLED